MERTAFWNIIEGAMSESHGDLERRFQLLVGLLSEMPANSIVGFDNVLSVLIQEAYSWDLWGAAHIVNGGCSDDSFQDFRRWLVSRGERAYSASIVDPESIDRWIIGESDIFFEAMGWVASKAYKIKTGMLLNELVNGSSVPQMKEPSGMRWNSEQELAIRFPRLFAAFRDV